MLKQRHPSENSYNSQKKLTINYSGLYTITATIQFDIHAQYFKWKTGTEHYQGNIVRNHGKVAEEEI